MSIIRNIKLPKIIENKASKVPRYTVKEKDYLKEVTLPSSAIVGLCEVQGWREAQDDVLICHSLKGFDSLERMQRDALLKNTCQVMQAKHGQIMDAGSTLNATIAWVGDHEFCIVNANIGDSATFCFVIDEEEKHVICSRVNKLHDDEVMNVYEKNGEIMVGTLSMSRAIGDRLYEPDLNHHADIVNVCNYTGNRRMFLVTACDGLTQKKVLDTEKIGQIVYDHRNKGVAEIAQILVAEALTRSAKHINAKMNIGSTDNISVSVTEVLPNQAPTLMAVFDGHGGTNVVSEGLGRDFYKELSHQLENLKKSIRQRISYCKTTMSKALDLKKDGDDIQVLATTFKEKLLLPLAAKEKISPEALMSAELTWTPSPFTWILEKCCLSSSQQRVSWLTQRELYHRLKLYRQFQEVYLQYDDLNFLSEEKEIPRSSSLSAVIHPAGMLINEIEFSPLLPMSLSSETSDQLGDEVESAPSVSHLTTSLVMG